MGATPPRTGASGVTLTPEQVRKWRGIPESPTVNPYGNGRCAKHLDIHAGSWLVYYVRRGSYVKIGQTNNILARLWTLNGSVNVPSDFSGIELLALEPAHQGDNRFMEYTRHQQFGALREAGEWFHAAPALMQHISSLECPAPRIYTNGEWREHP
jgi:hypothetical protein